MTQACSRGDIIECFCDNTQPKTPKMGKNKNKKSNKNNKTNELENGNDGGAGGRKKKKKRKRKKLDRDEYNFVYPKGDWKWRGCDDNVNFGMRKSREFLDARYKRRGDIKSALKLHNHNAGRLVSQHVTIY